MRRLELANIRQEWIKVKAVVEKRLERYGPIADEEIEATVQKYRHEKRQSS